MLQSIKQFYGHQLGASDGEIGHVRDFYFDDQSWAVRYLVMDTSSWLPGRQVLISPRAFDGFKASGNVLLVNLTRKQIENSPSIDLHKPISRQYEEDYHRHYGWPNYWQGEGLWGMSDLPFMLLPAKTPVGKQASVIGAQPRKVDAHLRSAKAVTGYHLKASNRIIGHVCDFMMDDQSWAIGELVIKTGHRFSGQETTLPTTLVDRISYEESTVFVNSAAEAAAPSLVATGAAI